MRVSNVLCFNHGWHGLFQRIELLPKAHPGSLDDHSYTTQPNALSEDFLVQERLWMLTQRGGEVGWMGSLAHSFSSIFSEELPWARHEGRLRIQG